MLILEDKDMEVTEGRQRADLLLTPSFPVLSQLVSRDKTSAKLRPIASVPRHAATRIKPAKADKLDDREEILPRMPRRSHQDRFLGIREISIGIRSTFPASYSCSSQEDTPTSHGTDDKGYLPYSQCP